MPIDCGERDASLASLPTIPSEDASWPFPIKREEKNENTCMSHSSGWLSHDSIDACSRLLLCLSCTVLKLMVLSVGDAVDNNTSSDANKITAVCGFGRRDCSSYHYLPHVTLICLKWQIFLLITHTLIDFVCALDLDLIDYKRGDTTKLLRPNYSSCNNFKLSYRSM